MWINTKEEGMKEYFAKLAGGEGRRGERGKEEV